jgi:hypothetical protein
MDGITNPPIDELLDKSGSEVQPCVVRSKACSPD